MKPAFTLVRDGPSLPMLMDDKGRIFRIQQLVDGKWESTTVDAEVATQSVAELAVLAFQAKP